MKRSWTRTIACGALLGFSITACGGGGGSAATQLGGGSRPPGGGGGSPEGARSIVVSGTINGTGPYLLAHKSRVARSIGHAHPLLSLKNVTVTGTLFPGDAGPEPVQNSETIATPSGAYSASLSFSNVPVHNNEWIVLEFTGNATDGSHVALGELAGLVNVTSSPKNSATLTEATTQTFQVFETLLQEGDLSTYDLDNTPTLNTVLTSDITGWGVTLDPTTHLYSIGGLIQLVNKLEPKFERDFNVSPSPKYSGAITLARDWSNASEVDLALDYYYFDALFPLFVTLVGQNQQSVSAAWGSDSNCGLSSTNPPNTPPGGTATALAADACVFSNVSGGVTLRNVYGGHLLLGATTNANGAGTTFFGGHLSVTGEAPGAKTYTIAAPATAATFTVNDPAGFAFGPAFYGTPLLPNAGGFFTVQPNYGTSLQSNTAFALYEPDQVDIPARVIAKSPPYGATSPHNQIEVDTFNAYGVPLADMGLCGGISCYTEASTGALNIVRPFADAGTKLSYFNYVKGGTLAAISQGVGGYNLTFSGAGSGTLKTTTSTALLPNQQLDFSLSGLPDGDRITVQAYDAANSNVYTGVATSQFGSAAIRMNVSQTVNIKEVLITIGYTGPSATIQLNEITTPTY